MASVIGIDLGTTNSCAACVVNGSPIVIPNSLGERLTPSVVRFLENGDIITGQQALRAQIIDPLNTISGIKRFIGRRYNEVMDIADTVSFKVGIGKSNLAMVNVRGTEYSPQVISAKILQSLKDATESYLGEEVSGAVITIPAYFNEIQKEATREAGIIAGLQVYRIINEPTAASIAYGLDRKRDEKIAVFDLGGGTFDVTILEVGDGVYEVKSIAGDGFLGGDDFDNRISDWIIEESKRRLFIDPSEDLITMQRIREAAIRTKCELSQLSESIVNLPFLGQRNGTAVNFSTILTRQMFEELSQELFARLVAPCKSALRDSGLSARHINKVILVGGATRMPKVSEVVQEIFGITPSKAVNPDEAVCLGAAIQAAILQGQVKEVLLLDVIPRSLGVESDEGKMARILDRNTTIPTKKSQIFTTSLDNQTSVEIRILEGEHELARDNKTLGRFLLEGIPSAPRDDPQIEVTFDVDANGVIHVNAKDLRTGKETSIRIHPSTGFSENEVKQIAATEEEIAKSQSERTQKRIEAINELESLLLTAVKSLEGSRGKKANSCRDRIKSIMQDGKKAMLSTDIAVISSVIEDLRQSLESLHKQNSRLKDIHSSK